MFNPLMHQQEIKMYFYDQSTNISSSTSHLMQSPSSPCCHLCDVTSPSTKSSNSKHRGRPKMSKEMNRSAPFSPISGFGNGSTQPDQDDRFCHAGSSVSVRDNCVQCGLCPSSPGEFLSFSSFSQSASSSEATHPGALRTCAAGPLCSRKVTRIMPNIMTTQFSSLARASVPQACRVRCCYQGVCALSSRRRSSIHSRY